MTIFIEVKAKEEVEIPSPFIFKALEVKVLMDILLVNYLTFLSGL